MRKSILALAVLLLLIATVPVAVGANGTTTVRVANDGATYVVPPGDDIVLLNRWGAKTKGQVQMYLKAYSASYTITNEAGDVVFSLPAEDAAGLWGPIELVPPEDFGFDCPGNSLWLASWEAPVTPPLDPGAYTLVTEWTRSHPVNDGLHTCTVVDTGEPAAPPPSLFPAESSAWTVTIVQQ